MSKYLLLDAAVLASESLQNRGDPAYNAELTAFAERFLGPEIGKLNTRMAASALIRRRLQSLRKGGYVHYCRGRWARKLP